MKYTRGGGVFYVAILADQTVRTVPEIDRQRSTNSTWTEIELHIDNQNEPIEYDA
jgi:hypothetical protein